MTSLFELSVFETSCFIQHPHKLNIEIEKVYVRGKEQII
jgi:hypothetical protein